jgi:hypothetical protein
MKSEHTNFKKQTYEAAMPLHEQNFNDKNRAYSKRKSPKVTDMHCAVVKRTRAEFYASTPEKLMKMIAALPDVDINEVEVLR